MPASGEGIIAFLIFPGMATKIRPWRKLIVTGAATVVLYALLFANEAEVMASFTRTDGLYPLLSVITAFVFSLVHGAFTAYFWDTLGVRPRAQLKEVKQD